MQLGSAVDPRYGTTKPLDYMEVAEQDKMIRQIEPEPASSRATEGQAGRSAHWYKRQRLTGFLEYGVAMLVLIKFEHCNFGIQTSVTFGDEQAAAITVRHVAIPFTSGNCPFFDSRKPFRFGL